jgi:hypothetical protein
MKGSDGELAEASTQMEEAVNELSQAVGLATLKTVDELGKILQIMVGIGEFLVSNATLISERTATIQRDTTTIIDQNKDIVSGQKSMAEMQHETLERMSEYFGNPEIAPKQLEIAPEPISTVPFDRDPDFIDRGTLLDDISERLPQLASNEDSQHRSRIALVGLGGVG